MSVDLCADETCKSPNVVHCRSVLLTLQSRYFQASCHCNQVTPAQVGQCISIRENVFNHPCDVPKQTVPGDRDGAATGASGASTGSGGMGREDEMEIGGGDVGRLNEPEGELDAPDCIAVRDKCGNNASCSQYLAQFRQHCIKQCNKYYLLPYLIKIIHYLYYA